MVAAAAFVLVERFTGEGPREDLPVFCVGFLIASLFRVDDAESARASECFEWRALFEFPWAWESEWESEWQLEWELELRTELGGLRFGCEGLT